MAAESGRGHRVVNESKRTTCEPGVRKVPTRAGSDSEMLTATWPAGTSIALVPTGFTPKRSFSTYSPGWMSDRAKRPPLLLSTPVSAPRGTPLDATEVLMIRPLWTASFKVVPEGTTT